MADASARPAPQKPVAAKAQASGPALALRRLGLVRDIDLALHLPLRWEDETRLVPIGRVRDGEMAQVEGVVSECRVEQRSRRQLLVRLEDDSGELLLRFLNFYPSQQKLLAVGRRVRARGEVRAGFFGREVVHPAFKAVDEGAPLPTSLTPVYPTTAALPQSYLRKAVVSALHARRWPSCCRPTCSPPACRRWPTPCNACTIRRPAPTSRRWRTAATRPGSG
jgi:ATP-dependent DNA helicase RecG